VRLCLGDGVDDVSVRAGIVAEPRQAVEAPEVEGDQARDPEQEHPAPLGRGHSSRLRHFASVSSIRIGRATAPTVSSDSVTSGAWKAKNSNASISPYALRVITWRTGERVNTTSVAPAATSTSSVICSAIIMSGGALYLVAASSMTVISVPPLPRFPPLRPAVDHPSDPDASPPSP